MFDASAENVFYDEQDLGQPIAQSSTVFKSPEVVNAEAETTKEKVEKRKKEIHSKDALLKVKQLSPQMYDILRDAYDPSK